MINKQTLNECQLHFAKATNQQVWKLLQKRNLTQSEIELMIHAAHASCYHWLDVGTVVNHQRSQWLLARVYSVSKDSSNAIKHAEKCLELTSKNPKKMMDFDTAYAYEAMARAYFLDGKSSKANKYLEMAKQAGKDIANPEDKKLFFNDLKYKK